MPTSQYLEITAHSLTAILAMWLGITVATRSRTPPSRAFTVLTFGLVAWSSSVLVERLSTSASATGVAHGIEEFSAALVLAATAHFSLLVASEGRPSRRSLQALAVAYIFNIAFVLPGVFNPDQAIAISPPQLTIGPIPGALLGWIWIAGRLATLVGSAAWLLMAYRATNRGDPRRRVLGATFATVGMGALGGIIRLLSVVIATDPWIGVSMVTLAVIFAASAVFSSGVFFAPDIAGRAFWRSLALGFGVFLLVGALLVVDGASRRLLGLDAPLLTIMALVVTIAIYEPATSWGRARLGGRSPSVVARDRLLAALGQTTLSPQAADAGVQPALSRVTQALDLVGASVTRSDGSIAASEGIPPDPETSQAIPLVSANEVVGELRVGFRDSGRPVHPGDQELINLSAAYVAAALRAGRVEAEQVEALNDLLRDRAQVESTASTLHEALVQRSTSAPGLQVFALGPFRVDRGESTIQHWGGEKAGTRQAQALFAFLFDRGERGVAKDEALELIWPDTDVQRADLAFHRTLGALRRTLDPSGVGGRQTIRFYNDRYRLAPAVVEWSDVGAFLARLDEARAATKRPAILHLQEEARTLYRGDYLDDCPFYGDSAYVEDRRTALRSRFVDLLVTLGEAYEAGGDRASAASAFREAEATAVDGCPPAEIGLARLASRS